jgi:hypothetical protein
MAPPAVPENLIPTQYLPSSADLATLTDEERDLYDTAKDYSDAEIDTLPPSIRAELSALKEKLAGNTAPDPETAATPEDVQPAEEENKGDDETPADAPATAAEPEKVDYNEIIRRMEEELRVANARYETLQGKYNAEVKGAKKDKAPEIPAGDDKNAYGEEEDKNTAAFTDDELAAFADKHGLDSDVISGLADIASALLAKRAKSGTANPALEAQVAELQAARDNSLLDEAIRNACGESIGLDEINTHPLFRYSARNLKNESTGSTAWDDLVNARNDHNYSLVAAITQKIVADMQSDGSWNYNGRYSATAEPVSLSSIPAAHPAKEPAASTAVKPSAVTPHAAAGVSATPLHTVRTIDDVSREYDALEKRFRAGDRSVVTRMTQLSKEFSMLAAKKQTQ